MGFLRPYTKPYFLWLAAYTTLQLCSNSIYAQSPKDTTQTPARRPGTIDSLLLTADSAFVIAQVLIKSKKEDAIRNIKARLASPLKFPGYNSYKKDNTVKHFPAPLKKMPSRKPVLLFGGGFLDYNFDYRSNIDTPYAEKNIAKHNAIGRINLLVAGMLPLAVNY